MSNQVAELVLILSIAHTHTPTHTRLDLKKEGKKNKTRHLIPVHPDAIIKSSTSENVNMIYLENSNMNAAEQPRVVTVKMPP